MAQLLQEKTTTTKAWPWLALGLACTVLSALCVWVPMHVIRPFRPQNPDALNTALWVHDAGPWISGICVVLLVAVTIWAWNKIATKRKRSAFRVAMIALCVLTIAAAYMTHLNIFEKMFHPYDSLAFGDVNSVDTQPSDMVLAVNLGGHARAYPILTMGYHHIVNDTVGGVPIAVTYCTLCHTGIVWDPVVEGTSLHFRLAGINNGNALLRDEETRSVWQQSTGESIFGPLKGHHLKMIHSSELTFALWRNEQPLGDVLKPDAAWVSEYDPRDWEKQVEKTPAMIDTTKSGIPPHRLMLGVTLSGKAKAYPIDTILSARLIQDEVGDSPVLLVVASDGTSIRIFDPAELTFVKGDGNRLMQDTETGSAWNFQGCATDGRFVGRCLKELDSNRDYWFDWMNHHPQTAVFKG
jgi:Protein of unknown function (DUF3179)